MNRCSGALPNFVIIGAHRAGTTAVYRYCQEHPQIFMSPIKETNFLAFDSANASHVRDRQAYPVQSMEEYRDQFRGVTDERVVGEASPNYLYSARALRRIERLLPDASLLLMLRNPLHRLRSMYLAQARNGRTRQTWQEAISDGAWLRRHTYYPNVARYVEAFGRDRLMVMLYEDLAANPVEFCQHLFERLEVDASFRPAVEVRHNKGGTPKLRIVHRLGTNRKWVAITKAVAPRPVVNLAKSIRERNLRQAPPISEQEASLLRAAFRDDVMRLGQLVELDLAGRWGIA